MLPNGGVSDHPGLCVTEDKAIFDDALSEADSISEFVLQNAMECKPGQTMYTVVGSGSAATPVTLCLLLTFCLKSPQVKIGFAIMRCTALEASGSFRALFKSVQSHDGFVLHALTQYQLARHLILLATEQDISTWTIFGTDFKCEEVGLLACQIQQGNCKVLYGEQPLATALENKHKDVHEPGPVDSDDEDIAAFKDSMNNFKKQEDDVSKKRCANPSGSKVKSKVLGNADSDSDSPKPFATLRKVADAALAKARRVQKHQEVNAKKVLKNEKENPVKPMLASSSSSSAVPAGSSSSSSSSSAQKISLSVNPKSGLTHVSRDGTQIGRLSSWPNPQTGIMTFSVTCLQHRACSMARTGSTYPGQERFIEWLVSGPSAYTVTKTTFIKLYAPQKPLYPQLRPKNCARTHRAKAIASETFAILLYFLTHMQLQQSQTNTDANGKP